MTAALIPTPVMQFLDADGNPLVGGKVYTYAAGTSTPLATYTDYGGATPNANPVILNSRGEASIWFGTAAYKLELYTAATVLIWTADNVSASTPVVYGTGVAAALAINVGTAGSILVNGGVLGTPSSGLVTNLTGTASININGTVGATTANTGAFTTISASGTTTAAAINASGTVAMAGAATVGTTLGVTGTSTMAAINASGLITRTGVAATTTVGIYQVGSTTGIHRNTIENTGSDSLIGVNNSAGTSSYTNATAYASFLGTSSNVPLEFFTAYTMRMSISSAGAVTIPGTLGVTGATTIGAASAGVGALTINHATQPTIYLAKTNATATTWQIYNNGNLGFYDGTNYPLYFVGSASIFGGAITPSQTAGIVGTTTNNNADAGSVGELLESNVTNVTAGTSATNLTSLSLTAGDWDVTLEANSAAVAGTTTTFRIGYSTTSAAFSAGSQESHFCFVDTVNGVTAGNISSLRVLLSGTTTIYFVAQAGTTAITTGVNAAIRARRRR